MKQLHDVRHSLGIQAGMAAAAAVAGFCVSPAAGIVVSVGCGAMWAVSAGLEHLHRQKLQQLNDDLDRLLRSGTPLPIDQYQEGELSILACQMEKVTMRLTEATDRTRKEKSNLADSMADISHQLRTPMTAMNLAVTMLRSHDLTPRKRMELTAELQKQLDRIDWLVETLLKISKLDAGTVTLARQQIAVRDVISRAADPLTIPMEVRDQRLCITCRNEQVSADLTWTAEALGNILKNCMEHTPEGGTISIDVQETPLFTQIILEDTGHGFAPEDLPHLFDRFYQGSNASPSSYGIGLSLARSVITSQDGIIQAMNGKSGAKFVLKFYKQII